MLKIKDGIDLDILVKKYGFEKRDCCVHSVVYPEYTKKIGETSFTNSYDSPIQGYSRWDEKINAYIRINADNERELSMYFGEKPKKLNYDVIYDLIADGLLVKGKKRIVAKYVIARKGNERWFLSHCSGKYQRNYTMDLRYAIGFATENEALNFIKENELKGMTVIWRTNEDE